MGKKSRTKKEATRTPGEVGPRQPCPCGSGKRYKACHGAPGGAQIYVKRPFEGMASECDIIALRELVPAATAPLPLTGEYADRDVRLCSLLPGAVPAMVRESGQVWLGLQVQHDFGDASRDLGAVLLKALDSEEGVVGLTDAPEPGPRLQDLVADEPLEITVHSGFEYWVDDVEDSPEVQEALSQAEGAATPTDRLTSVSAAYWTQMGDREYLRWVMPEPEDELLDAFARLHERGATPVVPGARVIGMFRAHGLLAPVWDLPVGTGAEALEEPAAAFVETLREALADTTPLTTEQRAARSGLANRQVTIRQ
ncbi:SEC-C domain-containing protein [Nocardioides panacisoli]|uniref:DUF5926 family protein n=1 Tax=Nocardioides panacisoli TaxID=627624 RepID=UPI001C6250CF|nr:DUF5926 family protein [Nocardioides panacisoli]QYJ03481.1 SEC-C domain-containing protein [Nocardioides panacisoli]